MPRKPTYAELEQRIWELEQAESQRIQTEKRLQESETKYRDLVNSLHEWVWITDIEGVHTFCSRSIENILGYQPEEIINKSAFFMIHPDSESRGQSRTLESGEGEGRLGRPYP